MKRCLALFLHMLMDSTPWFLPALFLSTALWLTAPQIGPRLEQRPWLAKVYAWVPPGLMTVMLLWRTRAIITLDMSHNEVVMSLTADAGILARLNLLFTGYGALEGALLALLLFALLFLRLPSLKGTSEETKSYLLYRMMAHNAAWTLLGLVLLFPSEAHAQMETFPPYPTRLEQGWVVFGCVALFTLLVMMSGEIFVASSHLASNNESQLLFHRAVMKTSLALVPAWWLLMAQEAFVQGWWERPGHDSRMHAAALISTYASMMVFFHASVTHTEGQMHQHQHPTRTLAVGLVIVAVIGTLLAGWTTHHVNVYGNGDVALFTGWRMMAFMLLLGGLLMLLPAIGYDAAHRPEAWWFRMAIVLTLLLGPVVSAGWWLLLPSLLVCAGFLTVLPWWLEGEANTMHRQLVWLSALILLTAVAMLAYRPEPQHQVLTGLCALLLSSSVAFASQRSWSSASTA